MLPARRRDVRANPRPCLTLFGVETVPSRGKNGQLPKILVTMKSDNLFVVGANY